MDTGELKATKDFGVTGGNIIEGGALANRDEKEIFFEIVGGNDGTELRIHIFDELFEEENAVFDGIGAQDEAVGTRAATRGDGLGVTEVSFKDE